MEEKEALGEVKPEKRTYVGSGYFRISLQNVQCPICGKYVDLFTKVHMAKHGLTREEFVKKYPQYDHNSYWGDIPNDASLKYLLGRGSTKKRKKEGKGRPSSYKIT